MSIYYIDFTEEFVFSYHNANIQKIIDKFF